MKKLLILLLLPSLLSARNIYFASNGNDGNPGTEANPYQTASKFNSIQPSLVAGDSVLFRRGDSFYGAFKVGKAGIIIASYGTGAKPILTGMRAVTGWTAITGGKWEAVATGFKINTNIFTIDKQPKAAGRTPNSGFFVYQSASTTQLTSTFLTTNWIGAEVVIRKHSWFNEKSRITAQAGTTITYENQDVSPDDGQTRPPENGEAGFGGFIQRDVRCVDTAGEWHWSGSKFTLSWPTNPNSQLIEVSGIDTVLWIGAFNNVTLYNIAIEGGGVYGSGSRASRNITIKNVDYNNNTEACYNWNTFNTIVDGCRVNNSFHAAIQCTNRQNKQITVTNNVVTNTGLMMGMGTFASDNNLKAVIAESDTTRDNNFARVAGNIIRNVGSGAIIYQGSNIMIERNRIDSIGMQMGDIGFIYSFVANNAPTNRFYFNRVIRYNHMVTAIATPIGGNGIKDIAGLYCDAQVSEVEIYGNMIVGVPGNGLQISASHNINFHDNTIYDCDVALGLITDFYARPYGNVIKKNVIYQTNNTQVIASHRNGNLNLPAPPVTLNESIRGISYSDSNYISNMKTASYQDFYSTGPLRTYTLQVWRDTMLHDIKSKLPPVAYTGTNARIVYNSSDTVLNVPFYGFKRITPDSVVYSNSVNLQAWQSLVLIDNGTSAVPNTPPHAAIAAVANITAPANQVTLTSNSTDLEAPIASQVWTKVSGPGSATIVAPTLISTNVTGLVPGQHQYQLRVTDSGGLSDSTTVVFTVFPAVVPPNVPPTITADPADTTITLPAASISARAHPRDSDGTISTTYWTKRSGPAGGTIATPNDTTTAINGLQEGAYEYLVTTKDNSGDSAVAVVKIRVLPALVPTIPVAQVSPDTTLVLPQFVTTLRGRGQATTPGATIAAYGWTELAGNPTTGTILSPTMPTTDVSPLIAGVYRYRLTVIDTNGLQGFADVTITVVAAPAPSFPGLLRWVR